MLKEFYKNSSRMSEFFMFLNGYVLFYMYYYQNISLFSISIINILLTIFTVKIFKPKTSILIPFMSFIPFFMITIAFWYNNPYDIQSYINVKENLIIYFQYLVITSYFYIMVLNKNK